MINKATFEQVLPLAQKLGEQQKSLKVLEGSPLHDVMQTCSTYGLHVDGQGFDQLGHGEVIEYLTGQCNLKVEGFNEHNRAVSAVVEQASQAVAQSLSYARNVVLPDVKAILAKVEQTVTAIKAARQEPFIIHTRSSSAVLSNPLLHELVERFSNTPATPLERREMALLPMTDVQSGIATGAAQFDGEIEALLSAEDGLGYRMVQEVLEGKTELASIDAETAVGVHLLCKAMYDNPYDGVKMTLGDYNARLARLIEQSGRIIYQAIEKQLRRKKLGLLYMGGVNQIDGRYHIFVNNDVYLHMLDKGLTPEAVIGNEFLGRRYSDSELIEKSPELTTIYQREMRMREMQSQLEMVNTVRESIERIFAVEIVERDDATLPIDRAALQKRLNARTRLILEKDLDGLAVLVRDLVCHVFYAHTDAHRILSGIDAIGVQFPEIDPREAALLATVEYVAYWVAKQIVA